MTRSRGRSDRPSLHRRVCVIEPSRRLSSGMAVGAPILLNWFGLNLFQAKRPQIGESWCVRRSPENSLPGRSIFNLKTNVARLSIMHD
jgi:hypothetical protein